MKLKSIRQRFGMTRMELSKESGINVRTIEAYEQGVKDIDGARLSTLVSLAEALGVNLYDIIESDDLADRLKEVV